MVGALQISIVIILVFIINITHFYNRFERTTAFQKSALPKTSHSCFS